MLRLQVQGRVARMSLYDGHSWCWQTVRRRAPFVDVWFALEVVLTFGMAKLRRQDDNKVRRQEVPTRPTTFRLRKL
jgi:hypothetical protein